MKWVLSQPPGSGPDNVARILSDRLAKSWGQAVVIENKPGGQNVIGAQAAARSPADGFSFYFATTAALVTNPLLFKTLPYDPAKDFVPVAFVARSTFAVLVKAESPIQSIEDLVARSKASPGRLRVLATTAGKRVAGWDNVPALAEKLPGFEMVGWFAVVAPTGTPVAAIERCHRDLNALLADKDVAERIATIGPIADGSMNLAQVGQFLRDEAARWAAVTMEIGVLPE